MGPQLTQQQQHNTAKQQAGGDYTLKEQRKRKEWLAKDALGGTLNYDQHISQSSSTSPYYLVPPQHPSLPLRNGSGTNWDKNLLTTARSEDNVEWTPQDSSYGAAVPAFGWVPKRILKLFEGFFVVIVLALLIFVVVKTGIKIKSSGSGGGEDISYFDDDDHYIAFNDDGGKDDPSQGSSSNDGSGSNDKSND